jgi:hypothetical protein
MPYIVRPKRFPSGVVAVCSAILLLGAGSAQAAKSKETSSTTQTSSILQISQCTEPTLTQAFLYAGDTNYYTLAPGEAPDSFTGTGWVLSGGASIKQTTLADGKSGLVLDLPSGSKAVSPSFCVTNEYPTSRTIVRNVVGSSGVFFYVSYEGTNTWENPKNTGQVHGNGTEWTLPAPVNMQPEPISGWQIARLTLIGGGTTSDYQLYNLYIDPYRR